MSKFLYLLFYIFISLPCYSSDFFLDFDGNEISAKERALIKSHLLVPFPPGVDEIVLHYSYVAKKTIEIRSEAELELFFRTVHGDIYGISILFGVFNSGHLPTLVERVPNLHVLDLRRTQVKDLSSLARAQKLGALNLSYCEELTDRDVMALIRVPGLRDLDLSYTKIRDIRALHFSPKLRTFRLEGTEYESILSARASNFHAVWTEVFGRLLYQGFAGIIPR